MLRRIATLILILTIILPHQYAYANLPLSLANPNGSIVSFAKGNITTFTYDSADQLIKITNPAGKEKQYFYDRNRNLTRVITEKGETINYIYDNSNHLIRKELPEGIISYTYDPAGNLISAISNNSNLEYAYDSADRLIMAKTHAPQPETTISYEYDPNGNRTKLTYPDFTYITYEYDSLNRLMRIKDQANSQIANYSYDALSRRTYLKYLNQATITSTYNSLSELTSIKSLYRNGENRCLSLITIITIEPEPETADKGR